MRSMVEGAPSLDPGPLHHAASRRGPPPRSGRSSAVKLHFHNRFLLGLAWRLILLVGLVFLFVAALGRPDLGAARIVAGLLVLGATFMLWRHIQRTNLELARFIDAVRFGDFSQGFSNRSQGSGFTDLSEVLDDCDQEAPRRAPQTDRRQPLLRGGARRRPDRPAHRRRRQGRARQQGGAAAARPPFGRARRGFRGIWRGLRLGPDRRRRSTGPASCRWSPTACRRPCWSAPPSSTGSAASSASSRCSRSRAS